MRVLLFILACFSTTFFLQCQPAKQTTGSKQLDIEAFQSKLSGLPDAQLVDVRTPEEFSEAHLEGALNLDINGPEFQNQVASLDKSKPVFVYCLSGGRSKNAAVYLVNNGFKEVYEMTGGMMQWRKAGKPLEENAKAASAGMNMEDYQALLAADELVLIDFNAPWCAPCKKLAPILDDLSAAYNGKLKIIGIDVDEHIELADALNVNALPTLKLYKKGARVWEYIGLTDKASLVKEIDNQLAGSR